MSNRQWKNLNGTFSRYPRFLNDLLKSLSLEQVEVEKIRLDHNSFETPPASEPLSKFHWSILHKNAAFSMNFGAVLPLLTFNYSVDFISAGSLTDSNRVGRFLFNIKSRRKRGINIYGSRVAYIQCGWFFAWICLNQVVLNGQKLVENNLFFYICL